MLAGFEETRRVDAEDELEPAPESTTPAAEEDAEDEPEPHPFDAEGEPETTEESAGPLPAVRLPVEGAPEPDFPEDPFADVVPEPEPLSPEPAPESSSPFFEEWTPSDFEAEEPEEDDATGETGELTPLTADIPEPTPDLEPEAEADLLEPAEPPAPVPPPPAPSRPLRAVHADRRDREPSRPLLPWILGGATVVILAALAWFWLIPALSGDGSPDPGAASPPITREEPVPPPSTTEMPTEDGQQPTENGEQPTGPDEAPPDPGPATTGPSQAGATSPATAAATPPTSTDAPATAIDRNAGVWTLVVASWTIRERAEQEMQRYANRLRAQGYPVDLLTETSGGVTRYRVAVGAFPDQNAAAQARERLGDAIPADTWILRVRPGM
ncbi:hypothetical protein AWN76_005310 [Rhodothermaceae bacterium RA]|nr:hypothetical protein AWN76_005310 [Rhodothermaceae bacterium RA]